MTTDSVDGQEVRLFKEGDKVMPSQAETLARWNYEHRFQDEGNGFTFPFVVQSVREDKSSDNPEHPQLVTINVPNGSMEVSGALLTLTRA